MSLEQKQGSFILRARDDTAHVWQEHKDRASTTPLVGKFFLSQPLALLAVSDETFVICGIPSLQQPSPVLYLFVNVNFHSQLKVPSPQVHSLVLSEKHLYCHCAQEIIVFNWKESSSFVFRFPLLHDIVLFVVLEEEDTTKVFLAPSSSSSHTLSVWDMYSGALLIETSCDCFVGEKSVVARARFVSSHSIAITLKNDTEWMWELTSNTLRTRQVENPNQPPANAPLPSLLDVAMMDPLLLPQHPAREQAYLLLHKLCHKLLDVHFASREFCQISTPRMTASFKIMASNVMELKLNVQSFFQGELVEVWVLEQVLQFKRLLQSACDILRQPTAAACTELALAFLYRARDLMLLPHTFPLHRPFTGFRPGLNKQKKISLYWHRDKLRIECFQNGRLLVRGECQVALFVKLEIFLHEALRVLRDAELSCVSN